MASMKTIMMLIILFMLIDWEALDELHRGDTFAKSDVGEISP